MKRSNEEVYLDASGLAGRCSCEAFFLYGTGDECVFHVGDGFHHIQRRLCLLELIYEIFVLEQATESGEDVKMVRLILGGTKKEQVAVCALVEHDLASCLCRHDDRFSQGVGQRLVGMKQPHARGQGAAH